MVTVLMECGDQEEPLARSLAALVPGAVEGLIREVLVIDRGSTDGSARVADAAGCSFLKDTSLEAALAQARSDWIFLMEPGARPLGGWIDRFSDHMTASRRPASLSPAADHRPSVFARLRRSGHGLRYGLLMLREEAFVALRDGDTLALLGRRMRPRQLACEIAPAEVRC